VHKSKGAVEMLTSLQAIDSDVFTLLFIALADNSRQVAACPTSQQNIVPLPLSTPYSQALDWVDSISAIFADRLRISTFKGWLLKFVNRDKCRCGEETGMDVRRTGAKL
jgi:hypothetical protein